ncbi:MAG: GerMN domain-containing protein [Potamolinea sp.]
MQDQQKARRIPLGLVAGLSAALLGLGGGAAWLAWNSNNSITQNPTPTAPTPLNPAQRSTEQKTQVYWLNNVNNRIEVVPSTVILKAGDNKSEILEGGIKSLLDGPTNKAFATTIPQGTKLRKVSLEADGVHVDLSKQFTTGGGSASMTGRLAQILYTASSLDPAAKVWISVEGKPLEFLGGEGVEVEQPLTRENFKKNFRM